jgi:enoyl-CoA hydratase/carnithine racemase
LSQVAALNGHAFGAGLFMALACDYRAMRTERGFICFPELNLGDACLSLLAPMPPASLNEPAARSGMRLSKAFAELAKVRVEGLWKAERGREAGVARPFVASARFLILVSSVQAKLSPATLREGVLMGRRFSSGEALRVGMIDREVAIADLRVEAEQMAASMLPTSLKLLRFDATALQMMKIELYTDAYRALTTATSTSEPQSRL